VASVCCMQGKTYSVWEERVILDIRSVSDVVLFVATTSTGAVLIAEADQVVRPFVIGNWCKKDVSPLVHAREEYTACRSLK
jgi:hypothetical protein